MLFKVSLCNLGLIKVSNDKVSSNPQSWNPWRRQNFFFLILQKPIYFIYYIPQIRPCGLVVSFPAPANYFLSFPVDFTHKSMQNFPPFTIWQTLWCHPLVECQSFKFCPMQNLLRASEYPPNSNPLEPTYLISQHCYFRIFKHRRISTL